MEKAARIRLLINGLMLYALLAGGWWSFLLQVKNNDAYEAKKALLWHHYQDGGDDYETFLVSTDYTQLTSQYQLQRYMIFGEGSVLLLVLVLGAWWVNNRVKREHQIAAQQRNFLLSITHELKSPIASVGLTLETFRKRELDRNQVLKLTENALHENTRLTALVDNLLLAARLDDKIDLVTEPLDATALITEMADRFYLKYPKIHFTKVIDDDIFLVADRSAIVSIVTNLLENAVKYSHSKEIFIGLSLQRIPQDKILLEISDQGWGIPEKERERVFTKFYRLGNEDTRRTKGTGLGLYIVKELVTAHGGIVYNKANHPHGTVFGVIFNAPEAEE